MGCADPTTGMQSRFYQEKRKIWRELPRIGVKSKFAARHQEHSKIYVSCKQKREGGLKWEGGGTRGVGWEGGEKGRNEEGAKDGDM